MKVPKQLSGTEKVMSTSEPPAAAEASSALLNAERARAAAQTPRPTPGWFGPVRAGLFAAFTSLAFGPWIIGPHGEPWPAAGAVVTAFAFLAVHAVIILRTGVIVWPPSGSLRSRTLAQLIPLGGYGVGWIAAIPYGHAAGAIASGMTGGITLLLLTARQNASANKARTGLTR
jgi:hypothetical protein